MAKNAANVRVALTGEVFVGNEGVSAPADIDTAPSGTDFTDLGYTTDDGVVFTFGKEVENIMGWQSADPLRILITEEPKTVEFTLRQLEKGTWIQAFGGTITEPVPASGNFEWHPPDPGTAPVKFLIVQFTDGSIKYRFLFRRSQDQAEKEVTLMRTDAVNLPAEYQVLAASPDAWFVQTDDPAMDPA